MKKKLRVLVAGVAIVASLAFMGGSVIPALAATATVTADKCNVRSEASTSSDAVFSVSSGQKLEVVGSVSGSDGYTWYKVEDGGKTGYIRADLVSEPDGTVKTEGGEKPADAPKADDEPKVEEVPATVGSTDATKGVVTAETVTVRSGASKETAKVASAKNGQEVSISGEATDSEGMKWYQVSYTDGDKGIDGYIRSDFLQITATAADEAPVEEVPDVDAEPVEVIVPEQPADYECRFEANSDGIEEWFLYDHVNGTKQSINNIQAVMKQSQEATTDSSDSSGIFKIIIIIMAVIIVGLIAAVVVLLLRSRDHYENFVDIGRDDDDDYDYESEDDTIEVDDYADESDDYYADEEEDEDEYVRPRKLGRGAKKSRRSKRGAFDFDDEDDEDDDDSSYKRPTRRGSRSYNTENEAWSTAGMLDIDDDMEFEFLDLDK